MLSTAEVIVAQAFFTTMMTVISGKVEGMQAECMREICSYGNRSHNMFLSQEKTYSQTTLLSTLNRENVVANKLEALLDNDESFFEAQPDKQKLHMHQL